MKAQISRGEEFRARAMRMTRIGSKIFAAINRWLAILACAVSLGGLQVCAQVAEPETVSPGTLTRWTLAPDADAPPADNFYAGGNGAQRSIANLGGNGPGPRFYYRANITGFLRAGRVDKDPANAYSATSDQTMTESFTAGTAAGALYINTYAKGALTANAIGAANITAIVKIDDITAGGAPVLLAIPMPAGTWTLNQGATGMNKFNQGWLNQRLILVPGHAYTVSAELKGTAGPIPVNTTGQDKMDLSQSGEDQYFNVAFGIYPPIPPGSTTRNPEWRGANGIRAVNAQAAGKVRAGLTLNGAGVTAGMIEPENPITNHKDLPGAAPNQRLFLINDGVQFVGATTPQFRGEHPTAVGGIIAAGAGHGVAPASKLYAVSLSAGVVPAAAAVPPPPPAALTLYQNAVNQLTGNNVTVINNSFYFDPAVLPKGVESVIDDFVNDQSIAKNIVFVASAGNGGLSADANTSGAPGSADECITVGALDYTLGKVADFSSAYKNGGQPPNLCAPGALIDTTVVVPMKNKLTLDPNPAAVPSWYDYGFYGYFLRGRGVSSTGPVDGTSFSAPMVTGAVALYQQLANLAAFAAVKANIIQPKAIRTALMTTAWKTQADGSPLYMKNGITPFDPDAMPRAAGGPINQDKIQWKEMGAGWLDVYDFLQQLNNRMPVRAAGGGGGGGGLGFAQGGAPSDVPGATNLAHMNLTGPRTLDVFTMYPGQQQEFTLPTGLDLGDSVAVTVAWDNNTDTNQQLDLALALYQSADGSTNGNPDLTANYTFAANGEVVLPPFLDSDPLMFYANGGWNTTEHLFYQVNSASDAGQFYLRVINLSQNTDTFALSVWVKSAAYPEDSMVPPEFTVTSLAETGGSVSPEGVTEADPGTNIIFTATPNPGFQVDQWTVNGVAVATNVTTLALNDIQTNYFVSVSFQMMSSSLDLTVDSGTIDPSVAVGSNVVFYLPVQNNGPSGATNVILTDVLPAGTTFVSAQPSQGTFSFDAGSQTLTCQLGDLAASNSAQVILTLMAPDAAGTITNEVSVTNDVFDAVPDNNFATNTVDVLEQFSVESTPATNGSVFPSCATAEPQPPAPNGVLSGAVSAPEPCDLTFSLLQGQTQTFTATPDANYRVQTWLVNGVPVQEGGTNFVLTVETNDVVTVEFAALANALPTDFPPMVNKGSWVDQNNVAHPWKVGLATSVGQPVYDDQFATMVTPLAKNGVLMHFAFAECFGGGMLQDLAAIAAPAIQLSGTSAAQWNQASWYREPPYVTLVPLPVPNNHDMDWADTYIDNADNNNNALNTSIDAWNDDPFRLGTVARPNASGPDESFPFNETAQYQENAAGSGAAFTHTAAQAAKYAILYSGRPGGNNPANPGVAGAEARPADPNVDAEQIVDLWDLLTDPQGYDYAPANIQVLFGNGALPFGAPANMKGHVVAATLTNLQTAFCNLGCLTNTNQFFFFANDHGVARNDAMPANAYLLIPRSPNTSTNFYTNIWLPFTPLPSPGAPQGLERYTNNPYDPFLGWEADTNYVAGAMITQPPDSTNVEVGGTVVLTVSASGTAPLIYQWQFDGANVPGATGTSLTLSNVSLATYGTYTVIVSNDYAVDTSTATVLVDGLPPVVGTVPLTTVKNQSASLTVSQILSYAYEPNGDPLTLLDVSPTSANGGTIDLVGNTVTYLPATNYMGADSFTYTVTDSEGDTATGNVSVSVWCSTNITATIMLPTILPGGAVQISFAGSTNCPYAIQRAVVITGPWTTLGTATANSAGIGQFVDPNPPSTAAYYRTAFPP